MFISLQVVANYFGNTKKYEEVKAIHWAGGRERAPPDTPECGFDGSGCPPHGKTNISILYFLFNLLPTESEERGVLGIMSIPVAKLPSCQNMNYGIIVA